jgi:hypothetical protein
MTTPAGPPARRLAWPHEPCSTGSILRSFRWREPSLRAFSFRQLLRTATVDTSGPFQL